ncbi:MAG TPA: DUF370 domain-containing protein [Firmicutes bacterium]|nr:DUF370 domain-containing protein [Bacillota bacterium]
MYLHLGADQIVRLVDLVAVLRGEVGQDGSTREMIQSLRAAGKVKTIPGGSPRSLVLTTDKLYLSPVSALTLKKRAESRSLQWTEDDRR